jgi:hypothetical protein
VVTIVKIPQRQTPTPARVLGKNYPKRRTSYWVFTSSQFRSKNQLSSTLLLDEQFYGEVLQSGIPRVPS